MKKRQGNKHLNDNRIRESERSCQRVYSTIIALQNRATTKEIKQRIDNVNKMYNESKVMEADWRFDDLHTEWTKNDRDNFIKKNQADSISIRNIQRCTQKDNRIVKKGLYYSVDEDARFENRYLEPKEFGSNICDTVINSESIEYNETSMLDLIKRFGAIIMYIFIEASRPFEDKKMTNADREDLVEYWMQNAVPLSRMFNAFTMGFNWKYAKKIKQDPFAEDIYGSKDKPYNEMERPQIDECLEMLKSACPDIFDDLAHYTKKSALN